MSPKLPSLSEAPPAGASPLTPPARRRLDRRDPAYWGREAARAWRKAVRAHNAGEAADIVEAWITARNYALLRAKELS